MSGSEGMDSLTREIVPKVARLVAELGWRAKFTLDPLKGGRNNRTFRVRTEDGDLLLKWYFSHQQDDRDRLGTEFAFCNCLWQHGIRRTPRPMIMDRSSGLGLYEFLTGAPLTAGGITLDDHHQALAFLQDVNRLRTNAAALALPEASEACFSPAAHVARIGQRIQRLAGVTPEDAIGREMVQFIDRELQPAFARQCDEVQQQAAQAVWQTELPHEDRILSPSDFGFHNALRHEDGSLRFLDFEYAGWDDPAKLVGDFFCQIEIPAIAAGFDEFLDGLARLTPHPTAVTQRARWLFPLYQIKWCCIVLNEFLPAGGARRNFSTTVATESQRTEQLAVAHRLLARVGCPPNSDWSSP